MITSIIIYILHILPHILHILLHRLHILHILLHILHILIFVCIHFTCSRGTNSWGAWGVARVAAASGTLVDCLPRRFVERCQKPMAPQSVKDYDQSKSSQSVPHVGGLAALVPHEDMYQQ